MDEPRVDELTGRATMGHDFDGIEELNTPMPRWWLWTFYLTIIWGIGYTIAFPAWPMISGATSGLLGYSTRGEVSADIAAHEASNAALVAELNAVDLAVYDPQSDLHRYAVARGASVFRAQCSQCHGSGAAGAEGYPNLLDNDWLWGGTLDEIAYSVRHGIRNETDVDARYSEMPAFGDMLEPVKIQTLVEFVPTLATADWDGSDSDSLTETIANARFGVMPAWGQRLTEEDVRAVSAYVHALGGGE